MGNEQSVQQLSGDVRAQPYSARDDTRFGGSGFQQMRKQYPTMDGRNGFAVQSDRDLSAWISPTDKRPSACLPRENARRHHANHHRRPAGSADNKPRLIHQSSRPPKIRAVVANPSFSQSFVVAKAQRPIVQSFEGSQTALGTARNPGLTKHKSKPESDGCFRGAAAQWQVATMPRPHNGVGFQPPSACDELSGLDLSHLTEEEVAQILGVANRAKQINQVENQRVISMQKQVDAISQAEMALQESKQATTGPPPANTSHTSTDHGPGKSSVATLSSTRSSKKSTRKQDEGGKSFTRSAAEQSSNTSRSDVTSTVVDHKSLIDHNGAPGAALRCVWCMCEIELAKSETSISGKSHYSSDERRDKAPSDASRNNGKEDSKGALRCVSCSSFQCTSCSVFSTVIAKKGEVLCKRCAAHRTLAARSNLWLQQARSGRNGHLYRSVSADAAMDEDHPHNPQQPKTKPHEKKPRRYSDSFQERQKRSSVTSSSKNVKESIESNPNMNSGNKNQLHSLAEIKETASEIFCDQFFSNKNSGNELSRQELQKKGTSKLTISVARATNGNLEELISEDGDITSGSHQSSTIKAEKIGKASEGAAGRKCPKDAINDLTHISSDAAMNINDKQRQPVTDKPQTKRNVTTNKKLESNTSKQETRHYVQRTNRSRKTDQENSFSGVKEEVSDALGKTASLTTTTAEKGENIDSCIPSRSAAKLPNVTCRKKSSNEDCPSTSDVNTASTSSRKNDLSRQTGNTVPVLTTKPDDIKKEHTSKQMDSPSDVIPSSLNEKQSVNANRFEELNKDTQVGRRSAISDVSQDESFAPKCAADPDLSSSGAHSQRVSDLEKIAMTPIDNRPVATSGKTDTTAALTCASFTKKQESTASSKLFSTNGASVSANATQENPTYNLTGNPSSITGPPRHVTSHSSIEETGSRAMRGTTSIASSLADSEGPAEWSVDELSDNDTFFLVTSSDDGRRNLPTGITKPSMLRSATSGSSGNHPASSTGSEICDMSSYEFLDYENDTEGCFDQFVTDESSVIPEYVEGSIGLKRLAAFPDLSSFASTKDSFHDDESAHRCDVIKTVICSKEQMRCEMVEAEVVSTLPEKANHKKSFENGDNSSTELEIDQIEKTAIPNLKYSTSTEVLKESARNGGDGKNGKKLKENEFRFSSDASSVYEDDPKQKTTENHKPNNDSRRTAQTPNEREGNETASNVKTLVNNYELPQIVPRKSRTFKNDEDFTETKQKNRTIEKNFADQKAVSSNVPVPARRSAKPYQSIPSITVSSSTDYSGSDSNTDSATESITATSLESTDTAQRSPPTSETETDKHSSQSEFQELESVEDDAPIYNSIYVNKFGSKVLHSAKKLPISPLATSSSSMMKNDGNYRSKREVGSSGLPGSGNSPYAWSNSEYSSRDDSDSCTSSEDEEEKELRKFTSSVPIPPEDMEEVDASSLSSSTSPLPPSGMFFRRTTSTDNFEELLKRTTETPRPSRRSGNDLSSRSDRKSSSRFGGARVTPKKADTSLSRSVSLSPPSSTDSLTLNTVEESDHTRRNSEPSINQANEKVAPGPPQGPSLSPTTVSSTSSKRDLLVTLSPDSTALIKSESSTFSSVSSQISNLSRCVSCGILSSSSFNDTSVAVVSPASNQKSSACQPNSLDTQNATQGCRSVSSSTQVTPEEKVSERASLLPFFDLCQLTALIETLKNVQSLTLPKQQENELNGYVPRASQQPRSTIDPVTVEPRRTSSKAKIYKDASTETSLTGGPIVLPKDLVVPCQPYAEVGCRTPECGENRANACVGTDDYLSAMFKSRRSYDDVRSEGYVTSDYCLHPGYRRYVPTRSDAEMCYAPLTHRPYHRLASLPAYEMTYHEPTARADPYFSDEIARAPSVRGRPSRFRAGEDFSSLRSLSKGRDPCAFWDPNEHRYVCAPARSHSVNRHEDRYHSNYPERVRRDREIADQMLREDVRREDRNRSERLRSSGCESSDETCASEWQSVGDLRCQDSQYDYDHRDSPAHNIGETMDVEQRPCSTTSTGHSHLTSAVRNSTSHSNLNYPERYSGDRNAAYEKQQTTNYSSPTRNYPAWKATARQNSYSQAGQTSSEFNTETTRRLPRSSSKRVLPPPPDEGELGLHSNNKEHFSATSVASGRRGANEENDVLPQRSRNDNYWLQTYEDLDQEEKELDLRIRYLELGLQNHTNPAASVPSKPYQPKWTSLDISNFHTGFQGASEQLPPVEPSKSFRVSPNVAAASRTVKIDEYQDACSSNDKNYIVVDDVTQITSSVPNRKSYDKDQREETPAWRATSRRHRGEDRESERFDQFQDSHVISGRNMRQSTSFSETYRSSPGHKPEQARHFSSAGIPGQRAGESKETATWRSSQRARSRTQSEHRGNSSTLEYKTNYVLRDPDEVAQGFHRSREDFSRQFTTFGTTYRDDDYNTLTSVNSTSRSDVAKLRSRGSGGAMDDKDYNTKQYLYQSRPSDESLKDAANEYIRTSPSVAARETYNVLRDLERNGLLGQHGNRRTHGDENYRHLETRRAPSRCERYDSDDVRTVVSETEAYRMEHELNNWFDKPLDGDNETSSTYAEFLRDPKEHSK